MAEDMIECVAAAIAMKSEGWTKNAKDYIPHAKAAIEAMRNGSIDVSGLVERLNVPWPEHEVEEVTLPAWILELCAEAATSLTALAAKVSEMEAENAWLWAENERLQESREFWKRVSNGWSQRTKAYKARIAALEAQLAEPKVTDEMVERAWARASEMSAGTTMANKSALREVLKAAIQETWGEGGKVE